MNKIYLIGNLTRDPEKFETPKGNSYTRFSLAVNRRNSSSENAVDYFRVTAWGNLGDTIGKYCQKGNKVAVIGRLEINSYTDKDGNEKQSVDVICEDVEFLTPKGSSKSDDNEYKASHYIMNSSQNKNLEKRRPALSLVEDDGGKLPF